MKAKIITYLVFTIFLAYDVFPCTVNISNIKANAVFGRVIDEAKELIPNAKIQIYKGADINQLLAETTADENGRFEIKNFPAGKYLIQAKAEHFAVSIAFMKLKKNSSNVKNKEMVFTLVPECGGWVEMQKVQKSK